MLNNALNGLPLGGGCWQLEAGNTFENPLQECPVPENALVCLQMMNYNEFNIHKDCQPLAICMLSCETAKKLL